MDQTTLLRDKYFYFAQHRADVQATNGKGQGFLFHTNPALTPQIQYF